MEKSYSWNVNCGCADEELTAGVFNFIINEHLIDLLNDKIEKYGKKLDLEHATNALDILLEKNYDVGFTSFNNWAVNKNEAYTHMLEIVNMLDLILSQNKKIKAGELVLEIKASLEEISNKLLDMQVTHEFIYFADVELSDDSLEELVYEVGKVNEGANLKNQMFATNAAPYDTKKFKNSIIDNKLKKMDNALVYIETSLKDNFTKINADLSKMFDSYYAILYSSLTDVEKEEKASKITKKLLIYKQKANDLEDYLADSRELNRQLGLSANKLTTDLPNQLAEYDSKIEANPKHAEKLTNERNSLEFTVNDYVDKINEMAGRLQETILAIESRIASIDNMMKSLANVIPSKGMIETLSLFKFESQDLQVKLEVVNSQIHGKSAIYKEQYTTALQGIKLLNVYASQVKELYLRNAMSVSFCDAFVDLNFANYKDSNATPVLTDKSINFIEKYKKEHDDLTKEFDTALESFTKVAKTITKIISEEIAVGITESTLLNINEAISQSLGYINRDMEILEKNVESHVEVLKNIMKA